MLNCAMKLSRTLKFGIGLPLLVLVLAVGMGLIWRGEYPTKQTAQRSFVIEEDFTKVRKIMVRTDAAKEIVTMGGDSEFVEQSWDDVSAEPGTQGEVGDGLIAKALLRNFLSSDPNWELQLKGKLKVRTLDPYINKSGVGKNVVTLEQNVEIVPDHLQSDTKLVEGSGRLLGYAMTTRLEREEDHTRFAHRIADRRVRASVEGTLANQEDAIRQLIADNREKKWLLPLK